MSTIRSSSSTSSVLSIRQNKQISPSQAVERMLLCVNQFQNGEKTYSDVVSICESTIRQLRLSCDPGWSEKTKDDLQETLKRKEAERD